MIVLYLYAELVGYQPPIFKELVNTYSAQVHVVHWDHKKLKPYEPPPIDGVIYYKRSQLDFNELNHLCATIKPNIIYVSGWMDKTYLKITSRLKKKGVPVVVGFDDIWRGTLRQRIGALIFPIYYKKYFSHAWVAGSYQYEFARRLGFTRSKIIFDLLSANTNVFSTQIEKNPTASRKSFIYVGNFRKVKGTDILVEAYNMYQHLYRGSWNLIVVGNGEMEEFVRSQPNIKCIPFSDENDIVKIASSCGVFVLPSRLDQWGVVIHEFTSMGLPLIISENVGARSTFLIEGFNGFTFKHESAEDLALKMHLMENIPTSEFEKMQQNSELLGRRISIQTSAANLMSIIQ